jgi:hypothetical protein
MTPRTDVVGWNEEKLFNKKLSGAHSTFSSFLSLDDVVNAWMTLVLDGRTFDGLDRIVIEC